MALGAQLPQLRIVAGDRVVHQDVQLRLGLGDPLRQRPDLGQIGEVGQIAAGLGADGPDLGQHLLQSFRVAAVEQQGGALAREVQCEGAAEALGGAGDQDGAAMQGGVIQSGVMQ